MGKLDKNVINMILNKIVENQMELLDFSERIGIKCVDITQTEMKLIDFGNWLNNLEIGPKDKLWEKKYRKHNMYKYETKKEYCFVFPLHTTTKYFITTPKNEYFHVQSILLKLGYSWKRNKLNGIVLSLIQKSFY
jgi:hypothetical protein